MAEDPWVSQMRALNSARLAARATQEYKPTSTTKSRSSQAPRYLASVDDPEIQTAWKEMEAAGLKRPADAELPSYIAPSQQVFEGKPSERDLRRSEALWRGVGTQPRHEESFTDEEFAGLTDRQRSLVNAQTQLYQAVMADREANTALSADERRSSLTEETYRTAVDTLFKGKGDSNVYAPRTVALLSELQLGSPHDDLDQILNGSTFLTKDQIRATGDRAPAKSNYLQKFTDRTADVASQEAIRPLLERGASVLASIQGREDLAFAEGLQPQATQSRLDALTQDQVQGLQTLMMGMALPQQPAELAGHLDQLKSQYGLDDGLIGEFLGRELSSQEAGLSSLGDGYISPQEFRARWKVS